MSRNNLAADKDADILRALDELGQPRMDECSDADLVAAALAGFADPSQAPVEPELPPTPEPERRSQAPVVIAIAAAALAIAAAVAFVLVGPGSLLTEQSGDSAGNLAPDRHEDDTGALESLPGKSKKKRRGVAVTPVAPAPSDELGVADGLLANLPAGLVPSDCEEVAQGVVVCADDSARIAATVTDGSGSARVTLQDGRVRVISGHDGESAIVTAGDIRVTGRGTVFDATLVLSPSGDGNILIVVVTSGVVTVKRGDETPTRVGPGEPFVLAMDDTTDHAPTNATSQRRVAVFGNTPNEMLTRAQKLFGSGKTKQAVRIYERLVSKHPSTAAAKAARVSLGRIELGRGHALRALAHFDAYLAVSAGSLVEEARYGRIRALRKLGRSGQEQRSLDAFLADYPKSIYATRLRKRAAQLSATRSSK